MVKSKFKLNSFGKLKNVRGKPSSAIFKIVSSKNILYYQLNPKIKFIKKSQEDAQPPIFQGFYFWAYLLHKKLTKHHFKRVLN